MWIRLHVALGDATTVTALKVNLSFWCRSRRVGDMQGRHLDHIEIVSGSRKEQLVSVLRKEQLV